MKSITSKLLLLIGAVALISTTPGCKSKPNDASLEKSVQTALNANTETSTVLVSVKDGIATLTGEVKDAAAQANAQSIAAGVKGVKSVQNNVTVMAPVVITPDDPLTTAVRDATKDFPTVTATVNDGVITVTGELNSADWKRLKMSLDALKPKKVDATGLKISK